MTSREQYILAREYWASVRLNHQHSNWNDTFGYLLHPSIPTTSSDPEGLSIIDVGTGTGCWPLHLYQQLKVPIKQLVGTDISDGQFPHHSWLPDKVKLTILDALDPNGPPKELCGQFDIVHAQYLLSLVKDRPDQLWGEPYNIINEVKSVGGPTEGLNFMLEYMNGVVDYTWLNFSDEDMKPFGLEILTFERRSSPAWQRRFILDNWCMLMEEFAPRVGWSVEKVREINQKVVTEVKQGSYIEGFLQILVARKRDLS